MRVYIEENIVGKANLALALVRSNWGLLEDSQVFIIEDFTMQPYWLCDYVDSKGQRWKIPMPVESGTMLIINYTTHQEMIERYAGGTIGDYSKEIKDDKITIAVSLQDTVEILELRIIHELLHAMELPADDCKLYLKQFLPWYLRLWYRNNCDNPRVQKRFYSFLLKKRKEGVM
jgi:hypothetical protein